MNLGFLQENANPGGFGSLTAVSSKIYLEELKELCHAILPLFTMPKYVFSSMEFKNNDKVCYWRLNNCTEIVYRSLLLRMARVEMDRILKNLTSIFESSRTHL